MSCKVNFIKCCASDCDEIGIDDDFETCDKCKQTFCSFDIFKCDGCGDDFCDECGNFDYDEVKDKACCDECKKIKT